ncbi:MAG: phosphate acyltransferase PlsX [Alphaproteobacteria bacterium]|nr:phosphate acyltransferase PlsX [Alphaproteobacteria bacterium]
MGTDAGPAAIVEGAALALKRGLKAAFTFHGDEAALAPLIAAEPVLASTSIVHAATHVKMTDKPMHVLRRGRDSSMWAAVSSVSDGKAQAVVSGGNTGALMAVARSRLGMIDGVDRPAISALWPTPRGRVVVLDVGANVEADEAQLVNFAIMGEAFCRALTDKPKPTVGLLNVGAEDQKGHELVRRAADLLRKCDPEMAFKGFVEGNDISAGAVDVVVTDGFTGNIALKSAEGAARLVGGWMRDALTGSIMARMGAVLMLRELKELKRKIDPSSVNGGVFLGVNGAVVKSHGGADAAGVASAIDMAAALCGKGFHREIASTVARVFERIKATAAGSEVEAPDFGNKDPGNQDAGNQDAGYQDARNQDAGNQDARNQDASIGDDGMRAAE